MPRSSSRKKNLRNILIIALIAALGVGGYFLYQNMTLQSQLAGFENSSASNFVFIVYDKATNEPFSDEDFDIYLYSVDTSGMTESEIEGLTFADYSLEKVLGQNDTFTPEDGHLYLFKVNGSDICTYWGIPTLGDNIVYTYNATEDVALAALSVNSLSSNVANTTEHKWTLYTQTLDGAEGTGEATDKEGWLYAYNAETDLYDGFYFMFTFNTTAQQGYVKFKGVDAEYIYQNNQVFVIIKQDLIGEQQWGFELGDNVGHNDGSAASLQSVTMGYRVGETYSAWDSI